MLHPGFVTVECVSCVSSYASPRKLDNWVCFICLLLQEVWQLSVFNLSPPMPFLKSVTVECVSFIYSHAKPRKCESWVYFICLLKYFSQEVWQLSVCHLSPPMLHQGIVTVEFESFVSFHASSRKCDSSVCFICLLICSSQELWQLRASHFSPLVPHQGATKPDKLMAVLTQQTEGRQQICLQQQSSKLVLTTNS